MVFYRFSQDACKQEMVMRRMAMSYRAWDRAAIPAGKEL